MSTSHRGGWRRLVAGRRFAVGLVVIAALGLGLRLFSSLAVAPDLAAPAPGCPRDLAQVTLSDAGAYRLLADGLVEGRGYVRPFDQLLTCAEIPTAEYPPLHPALLAMADAVGLDSVGAQRGVMALVGTATVVVIGLAGRRLGGGATGLVAAGLAATYPALIGSDGALMGETLAALAGAGLVLAGLAVVDRPQRRGRWAWLGLVGGLGALARPEALMAGVLIVAAVMVAEARRGSWRAATARAAVSLVVLVAVLAPWTVRNAIRFGEVVPVSNNAGSVLAGANCDRAWQGDLKGLWVTGIDTTTAGGSGVTDAGGCFTGFPIEGDTDPAADDAPANEAEAADQLRADGLAYVRDHLGELPGVVAARLGRATGLYRYDQQIRFESLEGRDEAWHRFGTREFQALALAAAAGLVVLWRRRHLTAAVVVAPMVTSVAVIAATYGNQRFRSLAEAAVILAASVTLTTVARRIAGRRRPVPPAGSVDG